MNYSQIITYVRIANIILALICTLGIFFAPEAPLMQKKSNMKLLNFAAGGMYLWAAYVGIEATLIRAEDENHSPDLGARAYLLLFWLSLTLVALVQRHRLTVEDQDRGRRDGL